MRQSRAANNRRKTTGGGDLRRQQLRERKFLQVGDAVLRNLGVPIDRSAICFHHPQAAIEELRVRCECRKPGTKSLLDASRDFDIDLTQSWMAGDQDSDLRCSRAAGCRVALIASRGSDSKRGDVEPDLRVRDLHELADALLGRQ